MIKFKLDRITLSEKHTPVIIAELGINHNGSLDKAIYLAKIDKFISSLKDGIETKIGDRGINISGGQRQRIGIARALYNDPEVLIFDEATSSLDFETENEILDEIYAIKNKTIIMISHNLESLNRCQKILKLKDGIVSDLKFNQ